MKKVFLLCFVFVPFFSFAQQNEREAIIETIQLYFDGMIQRDRAKLDEAFHPEARLIGYRGDNLTVTPYEIWATGTASGEPRNPAKFKNSIKAIRVEGYTALVETELFWPEIYYFDFLTLLKVEGKWKIVHKSWFEKKR